MEPILAIVEANEAHCLTCNQYFCWGHQAVIGYTCYTDWCVACLKERRESKRQAEAIMQAEEMAALSRQCGRIYLEESAHAELMAARVLLVKVHYVAPRAVKRFGVTGTIPDYDWGQIGSGCVRAAGERRSVGDCVGSS